MVTMVISELKSISRLKIFRETEPRSLSPGSYGAEAGFFLKTF